MLVNLYIKSQLQEQRYGLADTTTVMWEGGSNEQSPRNKEEIWEISVI